MENEGMLVVVHELQAVFEFAVEPEIVSVKKRHVSSSRNLKSPIAGLGWATIGLEPHQANPWVLSRGGFDQFD
jgi:hypothetical protein